MNQTKISKGLRSIVFAVAATACAASFAAGPSALQIAMADGYATAPAFDAAPSWRVYDAHLSDADRVALASFDAMLTVALETPTAAGPRMLGEAILVAGYPDAAVLP